jgi:hypothetical protein
MNTTVDWLTRRAESYWRDADALANDDPTMAVAYRTISDELRACAAQILSLPATATPGGAAGQLLVSLHQMLADCRAVTEPDA